MDSRTDGSLSSWIVSAGKGHASDIVKRTLEVVRAHLGMEIAYISEFIGDMAVFRQVDAPGLGHLIKVGDALPLDDIYCRHILAGRLPQFIPDTSVEPQAMILPITRELPIGKHLSVPIVLEDGSTYGMFCCLGPTADPTLRPRDLQMMKAFADLTAFEIDRDQEARKAFNIKRRRVLMAIEDHQISILYQPIWHVATQRPLGLECLARFAGSPSRSPDQWFAEAAETGLAIDLEMEAIAVALETLAAFPHHAYLAVNASPPTILSTRFQEMLQGLPVDRIIVELTEHALVDSYDELQSALQPLRTRGLRLAVDDAGSGYSSLQHILYLRPDLIKLDMNLTRNIDADPSRRALASALIRFARETNSRIIAEGVETEAELSALRQLGVEKAQGFYLGRPINLDDAVKLFCGLA